MSYDDQNLFAKILRGEIPAHKVYEDEHNLAFLDIMPRAKGHTLVIPKQPAVNILDIEEENLCNLMRGVRKLAPIVKTAMNADGLLIQQYNEAAAGQTVFHIHFHVVPRFTDAPLKHHASEMENDALLQANADAIRAAVQAAS